MHKCAYVQTMHLPHVSKAAGHFALVLVFFVVVWGFFCYKKGQIMEVCIVLIHLLRNMKNVAVMLSLEWKFCGEHPNPK